MKFDDDQSLLQFSAIETRKSFCTVDSPTQAVRALSISRRQFEYFLSRCCMGDFKDAGPETGGPVRAIAVGNENVGGEGQPACSAEPD